MAKYIVTGGAGFIGSNIVKELVRRHHQVKVIDDLSTGHLENLAPVASQIKFIRGDITKLNLLLKEFKGFDFVLHQAALASVPRSIADPVKVNEVNIGGTLNVLMAAREAKIKRVVYAASSSVYGEAKAEFKKEDMSAQPLSPYAFTKYAGEVYGQLFYKLYGLETISLRYFNVFGPNQDPKSEYAAVIPKFITTLLKGERPTIFGDGEQSRDFTYVQNNIEANLLAATSKKGVGEAINIACGGSFSLNDLVKLINQELKTDINPVYAQRQSGDITHSKADITKAKKLLHYQPIINFEEGLRKTIQWYKTKLS